MPRAGKCSGPGAKAIEAQDCKLETGLSNAARLPASHMHRAGDLGAPGKGGYSGAVKSIMGGGGMKEH